MVIKKNFCGSAAAPCGGLSPPLREAPPLRAPAGSCLGARAGLEPMAWLPTAQDGLWVWAPDAPNPPLQAAHAYSQAWKRFAAAARIAIAVQQWRRRSYRRASHRVACAMRYLQQPVNRSASIYYGQTPQVMTPEVGFTRTGPLRPSNAPTLSYYPTYIYRISHATPQATKDRSAHQQSNNRPQTVSEPWRRRPKRRPRGCASSSNSRSPVAL